MYIDFVIIIIDVKLTKNGNSPVPNLITRAFDCRLWLFKNSHFNPRKIGNAVVLFVILNLSKCTF